MTLEDTLTSRDTINAELRTVLDEVRNREETALAPLTEELGLRARVRPRLGGRGRRVE